MAQTPNSSIVKKYLEIGLKYKQTHVVGEIWYKMYSAPLTIFKIALLVSKIWAKNHIFDHGSLWLTHVI